MTHLALIEGSVIHKTVIAGRGFDLPSGGRVSAAEDGWTHGSWRLAAVVQADTVPDGKQVVSSSVQLIDGAPKWVYVLEDIPPEPFLPIPRRDCFKIVRREFGLYRDQLRLLAGTYGADNAPAGVDPEDAREDALIDFDEADEFQHDNPLLNGVMAAAGLSSAQRDAKWREWQVAL